MTEEKKAEEKPKEEKKAEPKKEKVNYVYGALLLHSAGKKIDEAHMKKVIEAAGVTADAAQIKALTASLEGIDIDDAISKSAMVAAAPAAAPAGEAAPKEEKKDEKSDEKKAEEAASGLSSLFG